MTPRDMGVVFNALVRYRALYTVSTQGRRRSSEEQEACEILSHAMQFEDLDEFLASQGMKLVVMDLLSLNVANEGHVYLMVRDPNAITPAHLSGDDVLRELADDRRSDSLEEATVWSSYLMLMLLNVFYTREDRPVEAISRHRETVLDSETFANEVCELIAALEGRSLPEDPEAARVFRALTKDAHVSARAHGFVKAALRLGIIEPVPKHQAQMESRNTALYRQTLWSAVDVARNLHRVAPWLQVLHDGPTVEVVVATVLSETEQPSRGPEA